MLFTIVIHGLAMASMALLLLPGMPGNASDADRISYIANHPWLWRLGWFPWQLTALSDIIVGLALVESKFIPRLPAISALVVTLLAVSIEQPGEFQWITIGVSLAQAAAQSGNASLYLNFEGPIFLRVGAWAALFYTIAAVGWTWCFASAGIWNRFLTWLSIIVWTVMFAITIGPLLPEEYRLSNQLVAAGNAIGFVLLMIWLTVVTELLLRRSRPDSTHGRMAPWRYPENGALAVPFNTLANSRVARAFGEWVPPVAYASDITHVIYVNYLVEAERLEPLVPWGLKLQRLGADHKYALFTFLTYNHGHFGPRLLGPLRRLMPSPVQSNWRIHVVDPRTNVRGIYFVTTSISAAVPSLLARLLSEGIPMHLSRRAMVTNSDGSFQVLLDPGRHGTAPDADARLQHTTNRKLPAPWSECFADYNAMLAYCVPQDRAMSSQPWYGQITRQEIELGIPLEACEPVAGSVVSAAAQKIAGDAQPLCFHVPKVTFRFDREIKDS